MLEAVENLEGTVSKIHVRITRDAQKTKFVGAGSMWFGWLLGTSKTGLVKCNRYICNDTKPCSAWLQFTLTPEFLATLRLVGSSKYGTEFYYHGEVKCGPIHDCVTLTRIYTLATLLDERRRLNLMNPKIQTEEEQFKQDTSKAILIKPRQVTKSTATRVFLGGHMFQKHKNKEKFFTDIYCDMNEHGAAF